MYKLVLTAEDRQAIDFVGDRYGHGYTLFLELVSCMDDSEDWDSHVDIEFTIPEHVAWRCQSLIEEDPYLSCLGEELKSKLINLSESIV